MIKKNKLLSFFIIFFLSLMGVSFLNLDRVSADHCPIEGTDPVEYDDSCHEQACLNGAPTYPICDCAYDGLEEVGGFCVSPCGSGQIRNEGGECVSYCNDFNACNPGAYEACEYESCLCESPKFIDENGVCREECSIPRTWNPFEGACTCGTDEVYNPSTNTCDSTTPTLCCSGFGTADANGNDPYNVDPNCPDANSNPPKNADQSVCLYCDSQSEEPACRIPFCGDPLATNADDEATCEAFNPGYNCVEVTSSCTYRTFNYCDDPLATGPNTVTLAMCNQNKISPNDTCSVFNTATYCDYPDETYCGDDRALNGDPGGTECQANNPDAICTEDNNTCEYAYCTVGFTLDIECPSGFTFSTPEDMTYWYSYQYSPTPPTDYNETCVGFSYEETEYLKSYFEQVFCGEGQSVACEGGFCGQIDWCSSDEGIQTDPTECVDFCPDDEGVQTSESQCTCANGSCDVDGECGSLDGGAVPSASSITGTDACSVGDIGAVTYNDGEYSWTCNGTNNGADASCSADIDCGNNRYYCDYKNMCVPNAATCNPPNDCVNVNLCVTKASVDLDPKLDVTPIINRGETCTVDIGNGANGGFGVFYSFKANTHCVLSSQDEIIQVFDPVDAGNTDPDLGPVIPLVFEESGIQKDMAYTLKCYDGNIPQSENGYKKSVGACRLNVKTKEFN